MSESLHLVCPHCQAINRLSCSDLGKSADCGKCHQALFSGHPVTLNEAAFDRHLTRGELPLLVDFWAPWCGPCRMMAPAYEQAALQLEPRVRVAKVNTEEAQSLGARLNIRSIPTLALFVGGREVARQAGAMATNDIVRWTNSHLA